MELQNDQTLADLFESWLDADNGDWVKVSEKMAEVDAWLEQKKREMHRRSWEQLVANGIAGSPLEIKVGKAICRACGLDPDKDDRCGAPNYMMHMNLARAAVKAMSEQ